MVHRPKRKGRNSRRHRYEGIGRLTRKKIERLKKQSGPDAKKYIEKREEFKEKGYKGREGRKFRF